jgi:phage terminase large subunit-like protein
MPAMICRLLAMRCCISDAESEFLKHAFQTNDDGRLLYPEQIFGAPKKSGKTGFAALHMLTMILLFGGRFAEGYALANDLEQAQSRVFQAIKRIVTAFLLLNREAKITADKIMFPAFFNATISAIAVAVETSRGWRITKEKQSHKIDVVVALGMAARAAVLSPTESAYDSSLQWVFGPRGDTERTANRPLPPREAFGRIPISKMRSSIISEHR